MPVDGKRCRRLQSNGRITNWEMETLRRNPPPRRCRWLLLWESLSDPEHATSQEHWRDIQQRRDRNEEE